MAGSGLSSAEADWSLICHLNKIPISSQSRKAKQSWFIQFHAIYSTLVDYCSISLCPLHKTDVAAYEQCE